MNLRNEIRYEQYPISVRIAFNDDIMLISRFNKELKRSFDRLNKPIIVGDKILADMNIQILRIWNSMLLDGLVISDVPKYSLQINSNNELVFEWINEFRQYQNSVCSTRM